MDEFDRQIQDYIDFWKGFLIIVCLAPIALLVLVVLIW